MLQDAYELLYASDGSEALAQMKAHKDELALVMLDLQMPGMSGMEVLRVMREEAELKDIPVIVLTADHYPYCLEKSDTWGTTKDYLSELYGYQVTDCFGQDHNALLIWSGCIEDKGYHVDTPVYSLDIVPTLSNLFDVEWDSRLLPGRDIFSDAEPLVLWPNCSWKTDLGSYNAKTGKFTPVEGAEIPDGYKERIDAIVRQKIRFSDEVLDLDYYDILFG
jgi:lipoteichoic acid synthase